MSSPISALCRPRRKSAPIRLTRTLSRSCSSRTASIPSDDPVGTSPVGGRNVYSRYVLAVDPSADVARDELVATLNAAGLAARPVYAVPLYRQPVMTQLTTGTAKRGLARSYVAAYGGTSPVAAWAEQRLPVTEEFCQRQLGFIVPPGVNRGHAERIAELVATDMVPHAPRVEVTR